MRGIVSLAVFIPDQRGIGEIGEIFLLLFAVGWMVLWLAGMSISVWQIHNRSDVHYMVRDLIC